MEKKFHLPKGNLILMEIGSLDNINVKGKPVEVKRQKII